MPGRKSHHLVLYQDVRSESLLWLCLLGLRIRILAVCYGDSKWDVMAKTTRLQSCRKHYNETMVRQDDHTLLSGGLG
jgi:hypothetical protein